MNVKKFLIISLSLFSIVILIIFYFIIWLCFQNPTDWYYSHRVVEYRQVEDLGSVKKYAVKWEAEFIGWMYRDWCDGFYHEYAADEIAWPGYLEKTLWPMDLAVAKIRGMPLYASGEIVVSVKQAPTVANNFKTLRITGETLLDDNTDYIISSKIANYVNLKYKIWVK